MKIEVIEIETCKVVDTVDCGRDSLKSAQQVQRGMNINLNHKKYYTRINKEN